MSAYCGERDGRGCGAPVRWVRLASGRWVPLDPEPVLDGNIVVGPDGTASYLTKSDGEVDPTRRFVSHFATCPQSRHYRKARS